MSSKPEPAIWSRDTGQGIACCDCCQLTITWMPKMKDVAIEKEVPSQYWHTDDNPNFSDRLPNFLCYGAPHGRLRHTGSPLLLFLINQELIF